MNKKFKTAELVEMIKSALEKHRDALSIDEVQSFEKTIAVLEKVEPTDSKEYRKVLESIVVNLLKFFSKPEVLEQLKEWFNN